MNDTIAPSTEILVIKDYKGAFCSNISSMKKNTSMDIDKIEKYFSNENIKLNKIAISDIDLNEDFSGKFILYTSSEDSDLRYKSYIEDVVWTIHLKGGILLPRVELLRAHHNKTMMEGLRYVLFPDEAARLKTRLLGCAEEAKAVSAFLSYPQVLKTAAGAGSAGVCKADTPAQMEAAAARISRSRLTWNEILREKAKRALYSWWHPRSLHRDKFISQNMIRNLSGDIKVLCFGDRFYALSRQNRPDDFRASGSGRFSHDLPDTIVVKDLMAFADRIYRTIDCPVLSLDIGFDGKDFWMIEFQCLHFGTLTAEYSKSYYNRADEWRPKAEICDIEHVYAEAVLSYIARYQSRQ
ncbi:MAG: hypothetical protein H2042_12555 [Rhizobiales bacterium]|nr:hypothetical protein [Hyphomicrobiales bacterium]